MAFGAHKTWSQEVLAVNLKASAPQSPGFFTSDKQAMLLLALKTALAAGLCYWLATLAGLQDGYWGSISAIIVLQSNVGSTVTASRDRLIGTLIGAAFGAFFSLLGLGLWPYLLAIVIAMVTCSLFGLKNSSRLAAVTVTILMLVHRTGSNWILPLHRVLEVLLGIVVALIISSVVFPNRARHRLRDGLAQQYLLMSALFGAMMQDLQHGPQSNLNQLWKDQANAASANDQLLEAARNEPSGGPASLEGLSLIHQFGRELSDSLKALEAAARESKVTESGSGYAVRLEPELGHLIAHIQQGFQYVAECIHFWKFDVAPSGFVLEEDIAAIESKMALLRPTVLNYPQLEILYAYAVQLHLKQVARLLRSSRIESSRLAGNEA
jgi:uncharacterized membrane protein YccC